MLILAVPCRERHNITHWLTIRLQLVVRDQMYHPLLPWPWFSLQLSTIDTDHYNQRKIFNELPCKMQKCGDHVVGLKQIDDEPAPGPRI
uniref:Uncharacterized protein n=1 Tax=Arundo donax TaxID=35708 RepID=A0A0A9C610_ARUDO